MTISEQGRPWCAPLRRARQRLVGKLVSFATSNELCSSESLVRCFSRVMEVLAPHTPDASSRVAVMVKGARLDSGQLAELVEQAVGYEREMLPGLLL